MIPKINFVYSWIYQETLFNPKDIKYDKDKSWKYVNSFINKLSKKWTKKGPKILAYMERITGLKWKKKEINCYVLKISEFYPFSDPLTIAIQLKYKDKITTLNVNRFIDILIHELIHNLFIENGINMHKYFQYLFKKYKNLSHRTVIHIPLYAVHKEIYLKFFSKKRLEYDIKIAQKRSDYKNAWDIVLKEGSKKIITGLKNIEKYHKLYF